ncbi:MAG: M48 family metallopeptidase [Pirellulaceae bacterium]|nr:M48 family metallopeptidase [Pirellulaceae bacterium]
MPITVTCPACQNTLKVKDEYAGKKGKCPKCQALMPIPALVGAAAPAAVAAKPVNREASRPAPKPATSVNSAPAPAAAPVNPTATTPAAKSADEVRAEILAAFGGQLQIPPVSFGRKLGTVFVLLVLALLPVGYWLLLAGLAGGLVWLWTSDAGKQLSFSLFWLAQLGGVFLLLCLLKPMFEPRRRRVQGYPVAPDQEKLLVEVVGKVCQQLNAPPPRKIVLECSTRLDADYGGLTGLLRRDATLTIGLPLLASLSVEQFVGLVAGQMAQYRRGAGCRATNLVREIDGWLWRSIFQRDRFDQWLSRMISRRPGFHSGTLLWPLWGIKLVAQAVLWVPMFIANTVASAVVRRTELDGDRCHARLVGGQTFADVLPRMRIIDYTWQGLLTELAFRHRDQSLPDSLPRQMQLQMVDMTPDLCAILLETAVKPEEKPFDSRPADSDRLAAVASEPKTGIFRCDQPASILLANFASTSRSMTWDYYVATFGSQLLKTALKKVG